jgi:hypothetical protein
MIGTLDIGDHIIARAIAPELIRVSTAEPFATPRRAS